MAGDERQRLNELSASAVAWGIAAGIVTAEAVVRDCLAQIEAREATVQAWACLDPGFAIEQARACDRASARGPLHGVPVGIKDVIDTFDMPTEMGSAIYYGHQPPNDAACVALLRAAGAVILGKTVTCEFAGPTPSRTRNPCNPAHTPGGSSSGSAAAVADFHIPAALGTQTGGSVLRPASYCGVFGFKPTFGLVSRQGVKGACESFDTIGWLARSLDDVELLAAVLCMRKPKRLPPLSSPPRIGLCRTPLWEAVERPSAVAVLDAAMRLDKAGAAVTEITLPEPFSGLRQATRETINSRERAAAMAYEWQHHRERIGEPLRTALANGYDMRLERYLEAVRLVETCRGLLPAVFADIDVLLVPCVTGEAPAGLDYAGDGSLQALWTALHTPAVTLPTHRGPGDLPVGIQLVAPRYEDERLIAVARWIWDRLGSPDLIGNRKSETHGIRQCL